MLRSLPLQAAAERLAQLIVYAWHVGPSRPPSAVPGGGRGAGSNFGGWGLCRSARCPFGQPPAVQPIGRPALAALGDGTAVTAPLAHAVARHLRTVASRWTFVTASGIRRAVHLAGELFKRLG